VQNIKAHADTIAEVDEQSEQNEEDGNEQEIDEEVDEKTEQVLDVGVAAPPDTTAPAPPKRERSAAQKRYQDYLQIAREELAQGNKKINI
jgi:hypothetical protein